jgi:hypothetical protein
MTFVRRQLRVRVFEALEERARQFRTYEDLYPFRIPHDPVDLASVIDAALADGEGRLAPDDLRARTVLRMEWSGDQGQTPHAWEAWVIALSSGIMLYCDSDGTEARVLASVKRGNPIEADGFFLELLAESRGHHFGIELAGDAPDRVRTSVADRDLLVDVFVDLYEGTSAEPTIRADPGSGLARLGSGESIRSEPDLTPDQPGRSGDFRADVDRWLTRVLVAPRPLPPGRKRARRLRDEPR